MSRSRAGSGFTNAASYFAKELNLKVPRSNFDRTHKVMLTMDSGIMTPFFVDEVIPGDTHKVKVDTFARLLTQIVPTMDNLYVSIFFFFCPYRIIWDNWKAFFGERDPDEYNAAENEYTIPYLNTAYLTTQPLVDQYMGIHSLWDYMGLPSPVDLSNVGVQPLNLINALPFRAHAKIYNDWVRDQNLIDPLPCPTDDGPDPIQDYKLFRRRKRYDYFTSALPWPQKGDDVMIPGFGQQMPFTMTNQAGQSTFPLSRISNAPVTKIYDAGTNNTVGASTLFSSSTGNFKVSSSTGVDASIDNHAAMVANVGSGFINIGDNLDPTNPASATINALRTAFQIQKFFERDARNGTRYVELLDSHFGVTLSDLSYRPELLSVSTTRLMTQPVAQTSQTDDTPLGNLAAFSTFAHRNAGFVKSFNEHGVLLGYICVFQDYTYQNQIEKQWTRRERFDFYWREFANLGEQPIWNYEIQLPADPSEIAIWGWQERYGEYHYKNSKIMGKFRSTAPGTLDKWHLAQDLNDPELFPTFPELAQNFIEENPPIKRIVSVVNEPQFYVDMKVNMTSTRPMPAHPQPGYVDHF